MKSYFKKFSIMFVMLLAMIGVGAIQNGTVANAATVGERLLQPEDGWQRYSYNSTEITYEGTGWFFDNRYSDNYMQQYETNGAKIRFNFTGTKLRILASYWHSFTDSASVTIDGKITEGYSLNSSYTNSAPYLVYEKLGLSEGEHSVEISNGTTKYLAFNSIDIESTGKLKTYNPSLDTKTSSISLNKTSDSINVGETDNIVATTTPSGADIVWTSSDETIATVDSTGKVTGIKEGQATITAQIKDSEAKATCVVTVVPKGTDPNQPVDPTIPTEPTTGDANLFIELVDGNIKSYNVSSTEIAKFKQWYLDRDNTTSNKPYYEFSKGDYKDYVIHDKIDWFEVR